MNPTLRKYMRLAEQAKIGKGTLKSKQDYLKMVRAQKPIRSHRTVTNKLEPVSRLRPGMMITYTYNAKNDDTLPYWDRHPLIIVTKIVDNGWFGINLHYLHPSMRARMFYDLETKGIPIIEQEVANLCIREVTLLI